MSNARQVKERIQLVRALSNETAAYLHTLPDNIWRDPDVYASACDGWKIADVITHLILGANVFGLSITNAVRGSVDPPMGWSRPDTPEQGLERLVDTRNAIHEDLFYDFNASCKRFNTMLLELDESAYSLPTWHPYFVISVERLIDIRASELAMHLWDIQYPIDRSAKLSARATPFLLDFVRRWLRTGFQRTPPLAAPIRYRFDLTDAPGGWDITISGDKFRHAPFADAPADDAPADTPSANDTPAADTISADASSADDMPADVVFTCDTDTYLLLCYGRLQLRRSVRRGRIAVSGDETVAAQFADWFKGV